MRSSQDRQAWAVVVLVFLFMLINYADKAVIGLSSVQIMNELHLSHAQFGSLGSAFFLLFSISGVIVGFLANRFSTKIIMLVMGTIWALALLPISVAESFSVLFWSRVVLGAAEGPAFPIAVHAVYKWFGDRRRALPTSVVACGAAFGTGVIAPLITWIIVHHGWHAAFGILGLVGLAWACLWFLVGEDGPVDRSAHAQAGTTGRVSYGQLLLSRTAIGVYLAGFAAYWVIALNIIWLANYLIKVLHIPPTQAAWVIALPSVLQMILAPALAYVSQRLTVRGYSSRISRGLLGTFCVIVAGISMICLALVGMGMIKVILIGLSFSIGSVIFTLGSTLIGEISPASQRGAMLGVTNSIHTLAGLCAPIAMGLVVDIGVDPAAGFRAGYIYAGALVAILGLLAAILIDPEADLRRFRRMDAGNKTGMTGEPAL
jgi:MFS transporter, ACS family, D-galactonate transporter